MCNNSTNPMRFKGTGRSMPGHTSSHHPMLWHDVPMPQHRVQTVCRPATPQTPADTPPPTTTSGADPGVHTRCCPAAKPPQQELPLLCNRTTDVRAPLSESRCLPSPHNPPSGKAAVRGSAPVLPHRQQLAHPWLPHNLGTSTNQHRHSLGAPLPPSQPGPAPAAPTHCLQLPPPATWDSPHVIHDWRALLQQSRGQPGRGKFSRAYSQAPRTATNPRRTRTHTADKFAAGGRRAVPPQEAWRAWPPSSRPVASADALGDSVLSAPSRVPARMRLAARF